MWFQVLLLLYFSFFQCSEEKIDKFKTKGVTLANLKEYTLYAYAASCRVGLKNWTCFWCKNQLPDLPPVNVTIVFQNNGIYGTYGFIGIKQNELLISFRGSESPDNWIHDFDFVQVHYNGAPGNVEVHKGFYSSYQVVEDTVRKIVSSILRANPHLTVTITGHSLGGALSILCAIDLVKTGIVNANKTKVINFGQPRVGNEDFAKYYNQINIKTIRVINQRDIIPHVPIILFGYYHVRTELWFPSDTTTFVECDGSGEDPNCSDSVNDYNIYDHVTYLGFHSMDGNDNNCGHVPIKK